MYEHKINLKRVEGYCLNSSNFAESTVEGSYKQFMYSCIL
jgi:hypothetical protein